MKITDTNDGKYHETDLEKLQKSLEEKSDFTFLKRSGQVLVNVYDLSKIIWGLKDGQDLVISSDMEIFKGRVKKEKLTRLPAKFVGKSDNDFDGSGRQEFFTGRSWVTQPGSALRNAWESQMLKAPAKESEHSLIFTTFIFILELINSGENDLKIIMNESIERFDSSLSVFVVEIPDLKMKGFFSKKTGELKRVEKNGVEYY
jgi:hypothetical protein